MGSVLGESEIQRGREGLDEDQVERIAAEQRPAARLDHRKCISLEDNVPSGHHKVFARALKNVLSTEIAPFTFARIIDGLPVADVAFDQRAHGLFGDTPSTSTRKSSPAPRIRHASCRKPGGQSPPHLNSTPSYVTVKG